MFSVSRSVMITTLVVVAPLSYSTLQTFRSAWLSESESVGTNQELGVPVDLEGGKLPADSGPDDLLARATEAAALPVWEFWRPGFVLPPTAKMNDSQWDKVNQAVQALNQRRKFWDVAGKHVGRKALGSLRKEELEKFAEELEPVIAAIPDAPELADWPRKLREMSVERDKTGYISGELVRIEGALEEKLSRDQPIPAEELARWQESVRSLERPTPGGIVLEQFPQLHEQLKRVKQRLEFWSYWNPKSRIGDRSVTTVSSLILRRTEFEKLERGRGPSPSPQFPEEAEHIRKVSAEVLRLADEELFFTFKERMESKKAPRLTVAEFFEQLQPIVAKGLHLKDSQAIFKTFVSQGIPQKTWQEPAVRLFDFQLPGEKEKMKIWLAHWDEKLEPQEARWVVPYDPVKKRVIKEGQRYLYPDSGFLKVHDPPEEVRIVKAFNTAHQEWQENLGDQDEWKQLQQTCSDLAEQLAKYYRQMSRFWDKADDGKLRLAPGLEFATDQQLIGEVLDHWSVVEALYDR